MVLLLNKTGATSLLLKVACMSSFTEICMYLHVDCNWCLLVLWYPCSGGSIVWTVMCLSRVVI